MTEIEKRLDEVACEVEELREQLRRPVRPLSIRTCPHPYKRPPTGKMLVVESNGDAWFRDRIDNENDIIIRWADVEVMDHSLYQDGLGLGLVVTATSRRDPEC